MRRRELLTTSAVAICGLSGCLNRIPFVGMAPEEVVTEFYEAQLNQDVKLANSHIHRESPVEEITERDARRKQINEYSLISVTETETQLQPVNFFPNESEVNHTVGILEEELEVEGDAMVESEIERYKNGTIPQVSTVSDMAEVEAVVDFEENGRRRRPTRTIHLIKDGNGWKLWTINTE